MQGAALFSVLVAAILVFGTFSAAEAAQLETRINPNTDTSEFKIRYQKTIFIEYPDGGQVADSLRGDSWTVTATADPAEAQTIANQINANLVGDGSHAQVSNLAVDYLATLKGNPVSAAVDFQILITGEIGSYVIRAADGRNPALVDMGWRGISIQDPVIADGIEINHPFSAIESEDPALASLIRGSEAEDLLHDNLINADFIRDQPLANWHFLFDPTGINADAAQFGLDDEIAGFVVSSYTMGESSIREGIQVEREFHATFSADQEYTVRTVQSADNANVHAIGFAQLDSLDGIEIFGILPTPPEGYAQTSTGDFPVAIVYGMAGMAAVGGGAFFVYSNRQMKKEEGQGQSGIDPSRLVGYSTSESSGGYKTNRGEAQLRDESDYQQTRSVYEDSSSSQSAPPPQSPQLDSAQQEAACGCAASADIGSECDCAMQGSCLCDADCRCGASVCKDHAGSF